MKLLTERLVLRPVKISDAEDMFYYSRDLRVGSLAGWKPHSTVKETRKIIKLIFKDRIGVFGIEYQGKLIGTIGVVPDERRQNDDFMMLGYSLSPEYWGRGIMTEAAREVIAYAFSSLGAKYISAYTYPENEASKRVLEKLGFEFDHCASKTDKLYTGEVKDSLCFILEKKEPFYE